MNLMFITKFSKFNQIKTSNDKVENSWSQERWHKTQKDFVNQRFRLN